MDANTFDDAPRTAQKKACTRECVEQILEALRAQIAALARDGTVCASSSKLLPQSSIPGTSKAAAVVLLSA